MNLPVMMPVSMYFSPDPVCASCGTSYTEAEGWRLTDMVCVCFQQQFRVCPPCRKKPCSCGHLPFEKWWLAESDCPGYFLDLLNE